MLQESFITYEKQTSFASDVESAAHADTERITVMLMMAFRADPVARRIYFGAGYVEFKIPPYISLDQHLVV